MRSGRLSAAQRALVEEWMPAAEVVADLSWNQVDTVVLRVRQGGAEFVVKAAGPDGHHFVRELDAHLGGLLSVWSDVGHAPVLRHHDRDARVLVTEWLPGELAYRTPWGVDPDVHRRAGALLRQLHAGATRPSEGVDAAASARSLVWLDAPHAIAPDVEVRLRGALATLGTVEAELVPTHGDWQPRNWLVDPAAADEVRVIDFGRFAFRPAATDFVRLAVQEWREAPACETAFFEGYGRDPRHPEHWLLMRLREAIGTACWAHQVGDVEFEAQGHRMIADALAEFDAR
ncbi:aminoglycoside phosphotransferase family protein [Microbacterium jejuense]|uniref:aminoglycoside phosphotransferase family protein n=1 Tax=Microbacterium jejuense TaxID=1263637 RepID=UPI0031E9E42A